MKSAPVACSSVSFLIFFSTSITGHGASWAAYVKLQVRNTWHAESELGFAAFGSQAATSAKLASMDTRAKGLSTVGSVNMVSTQGILVQVF